MSFPKQGIWGEAALREAAAGSFQSVMRLIEAKLKDALQVTGEKDVWPYVVAMFPDTVVVQSKGALVQYDYAVIGDGTGVTLTNPTPVVETFRPVAAAAMAEAAQGAFMEAAGAGDEAKRGLRWKIRVIRGGLSGNGNFYSDAVLREAAPLFKGVRVFVKSDEEHLAGKGKDVRNLIGRIEDPAFVEGKQGQPGEIQASFAILESAGTIAAKLREAWDRDMADIFGFSIDVKGKARAGKIGGRTVRAATQFTEVKSVDLIVEPGAGGQVISLIEAAPQESNIEDSDMKLRERTIQLIEAKRPDLLKDVDVATLDEEKVEAFYREALATETKAGDKRPGDDKPAVAPADVDAAIKQSEARAYLREALADSPLPEAARKRLKADFGKRAAFTEADVDGAIKDERSYLAGFTESGRVSGLGDLSRIEMGETRADKTAKMLDAFFDPANREVISFKECYVQVTGDVRVTGNARNCDDALMREALESGSFANVLGDSITRRMIADYNNQTNFDAWKLLTGNPVPVSDFRTQERTRWGGYGDLPAVEQSAPYAALASPTDEKATYAVTKRGGTESVTIEMIKNDDVGAIRQIPTRLSRAAKRTLSKFVFDFIRTNPVIYDGVALFHATHGNLGAAALDATSLAARRLAMKKQTEFGSTDQLGVGPSYLLVPDDLEQSAVDLFNRNTNNDKTFVQNMSLTIVPVWYWTDTNDWALSANPNDVPTIEIGFLDGNEEPELFVQDNPTVGSLFTNDTITWKLRHIYGGAVKDFRGLDKSVVA